MSAFHVNTGRQTTPPLVDGVVHNRLVQFTPRVHALFCTFFLVSAVQKLVKSVKIRHSSSQIHTATFYEPLQKCRF